MSSICSNNVAASSAGSQSDMLFFDKAAKRRLTHHLGGKRGLRLIEPWMSVYAVIGDNGKIITVGHR
jgi:hypothetical protein